MVKKNYQCEICDKKYSRLSVFRTIFQCKEHKFCFDCCLEMFYNALDQSHKEFSCPTCNKPFSMQSEFYRQRGDQEKTEYRQKLFNKTWIDCPTPDCISTVNLSSTEALKCNKCNKKFCHICYLPHHPINQCADYKSRIKLLENSEMKACQKCLFIIQISQGCNHMTCICGYQFCFCCQKPWTNYHVCADQDRVQNYNPIERFIPRPPSGYQNYRRAQIEGEVRKQKCKKIFVWAVFVTIVLMLAYQLVKWSGNRESSQVREENSYYQRSQKKDCGIVCQEDRYQNHFYIMTL